MDPKGEIISKDTCDLVSYQHMYQAIEVYDSLNLNLTQRSNQHLSMRCR